MFKHPKTCDCRECRGFGEGNRGNRFVNGYAIVADVIDNTGSLYIKGCLENAAKNFKPCPFLDKDGKVIGQVIKFNSDGSIEVILDDD